jgi:hypothetical protein
MFSFYGGCFRPVRWFSANLPAVLLKSPARLTPAYLSYLPPAQQPSIRFPSSLCSRFILLLAVLSSFRLLFFLLTTLAYQPASYFCSLSTNLISFCLLFYCHSTCSFFLLTAPPYQLTTSAHFTPDDFLLIAVLLLIPPALLSPARYSCLPACNFLLLTFLLFDFLRIAVLLLIPPALLYLLTFLFDFLLLAVLLLIPHAHLYPAYNSCLPACNLLLLTLLLFDILLLAVPLLITPALSPANDCLPACNLLLLTSLLFCFLLLALLLIPAFIFLMLTPPACQPATYFCSLSSY